MAKDLVIGYAAAFLTMIAFVPTLYSIYKRGNAKGISLTTTVLYLVSLVLWVIHGVRTGDVPLALQGAFSGCIQLGILIMILYQK